MRCLAILLFIALLAGYSRTDEQPTADAPDVSGSESVSFAGDWLLQALPMEGDSVLVEVKTTATDTPEGWSMELDHLDEPIPATSVVIAGDSATAAYGPFLNVLREGVMVSITTVVYVYGDEMIGHFTATYEEGEPSVLEGRLVGTRPE